MKCEDEPKMSLAQVLMLNLLFNHRYAVSNTLHFQQMYFLIIESQKSLTFCEACV